MSQNDSLGEGAGDRTRLNPSILLTAIGHDKAPREKIMSVSGAAQQQLQNSAAAFSAEERKQLDNALKRAHQFELAEEMDLMRQPLEGQLMKFTNVVQGWQSRWFVLDPVKGELRYYLKEEHKNQHRIRAAVQLIGAVVSPSQEDSLAFTVTPAAGDTLKLKAADTKARQAWINRLRTTAEDQRERRLQKALTAQAKTPELPESVRRGTAKEGAIFHQLHQVLTTVADQHQQLSRITDQLQFDTDILMFKATSRSAIDNMEQCERILAGFADPRYGGTGRNKIHLSKHFKTLSMDDTVTNAEMPKIAVEFAEDALTLEPLDIPAESAEEPDQSSHVDADLGAMTDDQKSRVLGILNPLKLGTDLTRVSLPVFVMQSRSFLESLSDFFANARLLIAVANADSPEQRIIQLVKWYLTSFYEGCRDGQVLKPYNPVLGEVFRCTWVVPGSNESAAPCKLKVVAEQVSHHPPVSAIYVSCPEQSVHFAAHVWPKSKYMGMSLSAVLIGEGRLVIGRRPNRPAEVYKMTFPTAYARSIMTAPWFELGGKVSITCQQSACSASITFHTKPFYGGKLHRVAGEIKNANGQPFCKVQGEWNRMLEFVHTDGSRSETLLVDDLINRTKAQRLIRPTAQQHSRESRRVWRQVTTALRAGEIDEADDRKLDLEAAQRSSPMRSPHAATGGFPDNQSETDAQSNHSQQQLPEYKSDTFELTESGWLPIAFPGVLDA